MEKEKKVAAKKEKKPTTPFYSQMVTVFFSFYEKSFGIKPSFDGSAPRDLKNILDAMQKRSEEKGVAWTELIAGAMLNKFLEYALMDSWLKENFLLFNLNRQKDKLFLRIKTDIDGKSNSKTGATKQRSSYKTAGQAVFADRLKDRLEKLQ